MESDVDTDTVTLLGHLLSQRGGRLRHRGVPWLDMGKIVPSSRSSVWAAHVCP